MLSWQSFFLRAWVILFHCSSFSGVWLCVERSEVILMYLPFYVSWCFCFIAFSVCSLFSSVVILIMIWYGVVLFWSCLFGVQNASWTWVYISLHKFGKISPIISLNRFPMPLVYISATSSTPHDHICTSEKGKSKGKNEGGWIWKMYFVFVYENRRMKHVKIVLRRGEWGRTMWRMHLIKI
jgi:hypothetical protein